MSTALTLRVLEGTFAILRFDADAEVPTWADQAPPFWASTRTAVELTVICPETPGNRSAIAELPDSRKQCEWSAFGVVGVLDFSLTGILAALSDCLAQAKISIFAISTFDTDYILVKRSDLGAAREALAASGYEVED